MSRKKPKFRDVRKDFYASVDVMYSTAREQNAAFVRRLRDPELYEFEDRWCNQFFMPIVDFMGAYDTHEAVIDCRHKDTGAVCHDVQHHTTIPRVVRVNHTAAQMAFSGAHWNSCRPGETVWFDPYDEYQPPGTNQFCQTFSVMYLNEDWFKRLGECWLKQQQVLINKGYPVGHPAAFTKYYYYTREALLFIKDVIEFTVGDKNMKTNLTICIKELLRHPNACINIVKLAI